MSLGYNGETYDVVQIQYAVIMFAYPHGNGSPPRGPAEPHNKALGTARPAGRTVRTEPSQLRRIDKSSEFFDLTYFDPPKGLERHVLALFDVHYHEEVWEDRHPAAMGQLLITVKGSGCARFGERLDEFGPKPILFNGFEVAAPHTLYGPSRFIGASFSPIGWAALTQVSVKDYRDRVVPACELLGEEVDFFTGDLIARCNQGRISGEQACLELAEWIRPRLRPIPEEHQRVIQLVLAWLGSSLNPSIDALFEGQPYSRRQTERLVQRYFGFAPRALARKFRAVRAANLLAQPDLTYEAEAELAEAFVDQPHMIKEIRRFCGYTPSRLGGDEDPMFIRLTHLQNLDRLTPYRTLGADARVDDSSR